MGNYDPNILPFYSLPYYAKKYHRSLISGQHYKSCRDRALKNFSSKGINTMLENDIFIYAIASEDEAIKNIILENRAKFFCPTDYSYYAIGLTPYIFNGNTTALQFYIEKQALSEKIRDEFDSMFGSKIPDHDIILISTAADEIPNANDGNPNLFSEVLKFFLERSEFIPSRYVTEKYDSLVHKFIIERKESYKISLKWKTIKELKEFFEKNHSILYDLENHAFADLVNDGDSKPYKPSDEVYYFCKYNYNTGNYYLKRDLEKSPKRQKKPASN